MNANRARTLQPCAPLTAATTAAETAHALAARLGRSATLALFDELALSPKPGLVTLDDSGSHSDMNAQTFVRSLFALRSYFPRIAALGARRAAFRELELCGIEAEHRMSHATGGVNTHRGAIFSLGLLCAAAAASLACGDPACAHRIRATLIACWGDDLQQRAARTSKLPGGRASARYALRSASSEAAMGFPALFETAVPSAANDFAQHAPLEAARLNALFSVMAVLDDANLAHRGGLEGLRFAQQEARRYLAMGGATADDGKRRALAMGGKFVARRLSPGGSADMLAALCFLQRIGAVPGRA